MPKIGVFPPIFGASSPFFHLFELKNNSPWLAVLGNAIVGSIFTATAYLIGVVFQQQYMKALKFNYELILRVRRDIFFIHSRRSQMFPTWLAAARDSLRSYFSLRPWRFLLF
jgi:hypothetical protein